jgi:hypothetical protein
MVVARATSYLIATVGAIALCGLMLPPTATASAREDNGCSANVQNPHISNSHGGIDVTATFRCDDVPTQIDLLSPGGLALWNCQTKPTRSLSYLENNCNIVGHNQENPVNITKAGKGGQQFRTAPPLSDPAAHGHGWWIATAIWQSHGPNGTGTKTTDIGNAAPISDRAAHHLRHN